MSLLSNHKKNVLIVQTGGIVPRRDPGIDEKSTIDKVYPRHVGAYGFEIGQPAVENVLTRLGPLFPFRIETVCQKDSQDVSNADREDILRTVVEGDERLVLITHGTDTMCETAQYLVNAGAGQGRDYGPGIGEKVIVITGAFKPECMKDSDADFNIGFGIGVLQALPHPGVYICMGGDVIPGEFSTRDGDGKFVDGRFLMTM